MFPSIASRRSELGLLQVTRLYCMDFMHNLFIVFHYLHFFILISSVIFCLPIPYIFCKVYQICGMKWSISTFKNRNYS